MKRFSLILIMLCAAWFVGCNKDDDGGNGPDNNGTISLMDGSIIINNHPDVKITSLNKFPTGIATENGYSASRKRMGIKATAEDESGTELQGNDYRFKLVAEMSTLKIDRVDVQATHVKITDDGYAFVSYNEKGDPHRGGVVVYKFTVTDGSLDDIEVKVVAISSMEMPKAEVSAIDYSNGKLYLTGASSDPIFGYNTNKDGYNYAFFMAMELNADKTFKDVDQNSIVKLTSFQGTSIRVSSDRVYITVGDGTNGTDGGLYIYNATDYTLVKSILNKDHARSVDVDAANIFLMQAQPARITKYDLEGNSETLIYSKEDESLQKDAKSEMLAWDKYLFAAENESGLRMILKEDGTLNASLNRPGDNAETEVTNSVSMNSDLKKNYGGKDVQSNLLFLANGQKGLYWYDVMKDADGKDWIVPGKDNSFMLGDGSANFVASKGNIVFVADGLGGLKVLYIGFNNGDTPPPPLPSACDQFMPYLYKAGDGLLPEGKSVFSGSADRIVKDYLFSNPADVPNYIEVLNSTNLYISFLGQWASWSNAMGYFVIPASVEKTTAAEYEYYLNTIKPDMVSGKNNVLKDEYKLFNNIKALKVGDTYQIGNKKFNAGDRIVLFIAPDSWSSQNNQVEVSFGSYNQIFFTHAGINLSSGIKYHSNYGTFKGVQYNTFYSVDCKSIVMFFEDKHSSSPVDTDFNDCFFSITDNTTGNDAVNISLPKYAISVETGDPKIMETADLFK